MKPRRTQWPRPSHAFGLFAVAGVLGALLQAAQPAPPWRGSLAVGGVPTVPPGRLRFAPAGRLPLLTEPPGAIDRCLVPAPDVDPRFVVPAPVVDERSVVAPRVWGMPLRTQGLPGR